MKNISHIIDNRRRVLLDTLADIKLKETTVNLKKLTC